MRYEAIAHVVVTVEAENKDAADQMAGSAFDVLSAEQWREFCVTVDTDIAPHGRVWAWADGTPLTADECEALGYDPGGRDQ